MRRTAQAVAAAGMMGLLALSGPANSEETTPNLDRAAVEQIVRDYLLANPELMLEVQQALEAKQDALRLAAQKKTLDEQHATIYDSKYQMVIGNPQAKTTIVEFFDYNCGFCRRALADMNRILEDNDDIKFVLKEFPVLGEASLAAHRVSMSLIRNYPELYPDFHRELLGHDGRKDGDVALEIAGRLGADRQTLLDDLDNPESMAAFSEVYELADGLGVTGTPSYVIGNEVIFGAVGYDRLKPSIDKAVQ
ncbi:MAG: DsbA family protein [Nitratireductor sp.]|nr:DsbA family protein [Nitratireductor sp.]